MSSVFFHYYCYYYYYFYFTSFKNTTHVKARVILCLFTLLSQQQYLTVQCTAVNLITYCAKVKRVASVTVCAANKVDGIGAFFFCCGWLFCVTSKSNCTVPVDGLLLSQGKNLVGTCESREKFHTHILSSLFIYNAFLYVLLRRTASRYDCVIRHAVLLQYFLRNFARHW